MRWILGVGFGSMVIVLLLLIPFLITPNPRRADLTEAKNNARGLGLALLEFETTFGRFPDGSTTAEVKRENPATTLTLSNATSNDVFVQLLAAEIVESEYPFYARAKSAKRPDNVFNTDATALAHGETSFAFISGLSNPRDPKTPLVFGPVIPGTTTPDTKSCEGKAVVLRMDLTVQSLDFDSKGRILDNGMDLLDPRQPYWHGKVPDVKWPK